MAQKYYYDRNVTEPTVDTKICSGVPELVHYQTSILQEILEVQLAYKHIQRNFKVISKYLRQGFDNAFDMAKEETLDYYFKHLGFSPK